ncbi:MAG TPA: hypothetical protein VJ570_01800 [Holophagaceae bacterium]|nr:hypothetical protein [Holophagaceae bacterium]
MIPVLLLQAPPAPSQDPLAILRPLEGEWVGEGSGRPGEGSGGCTFRPDLGGRTFVRRNWAEYPAAQGRPAFRHEDLLVVGATPKGLQAVYWDNEGHRIDYAVTSPEPGVVLFLGEIQPGAPRFRMTYRCVGKDGLALRFEIAPPGQPEAFKTYLEAKLRRK